MTLDILLLAVALIGVVKSADWFLSSAEKIGVSLNLPPFILGVVLVGFGTSLPELTTSLAAISDGVDTVSIANIAGSNIANVLLIIGISTIALGTIRFDKNLIDLDLPLIVGITALFGILLVDGGLSRFDGVFLLIGFVGYMFYSLVFKDEEEHHHKGLISLIGALSKQTKKQVESHKKANPRTYVLALLSIALLGLSSKIAVDSLLGIVEQVDVGVDVLSFFALAIGTSLPELVVSFKALKKGQGDIVVGNIIGSSMFNILLIGGVASVLKPQTINPDLVVWTIAGMGISVVLLVISSITRRIHMWEGFSFLLIYIALASRIAQV